MAWEYDPAQKFYSVKEEFDIADCFPQVPDAPFPQDTVDCAFIVDEGYVNVTAVAINSLRRSRAPETKIRVHVIAAALSEYSEKIFKLLEEKDFSVEIVRVEKSVLDKLSGLHKYLEKGNYCMATPAALLKFSLPELLPNLNRVLYLDGDTLIRRDLRELFQTPLGDNYAAAVTDAGTITWWMNPQIRPLGKWRFNAGMMLLNLALMRERNMSKKLLDAKKRSTDFRLMDQPFFNKCFAGNVKLLPLKYNFLPVWFYKNSEKLSLTEHKERALQIFGLTISHPNDILSEDVHVVHFAGTIKPWNNAEIPFAQDWLDANQDFSLTWNRALAAGTLKFTPKVPEIDGELDRNVIVSLTSYPARIKTVHETIKTLLAQTWKADRIILWLADSQFPQKEKELPTELLTLRECGLEIRWCEDFKSYKKLIPALKAFPNDVIITVDDDLLLAPTWLEKLVAAYAKNPECITTHRAHGVVFSAENTLAPYKTWKWNIKPSLPSFNNFLTGSGGCAYPPTRLHKDVLDSSKFMSLCPHGDDIWFWAMAVLAGTKINVTPDVFPLKYVSGSQTTALWRSNVLGNENDRALTKILNAYPEILPRLERDYIPKEKSRKSPKPVSLKTGTAETEKAPRKKYPAVLVRLGAMFILNKAARKRWRERHMDLTPRDGIDLRAHPELRRDPALKRFAVRTLALFIFSKKARKAFREKHLNLRPRDGVDVRKISPSAIAEQRARKRSRNPFWRVFDAIVPATRGKIAHAERHLRFAAEEQTQTLQNRLNEQTRTLQNRLNEQTQILLAELRRSRDEANRKFDALQRELSLARERTDALSRDNERLMLKMLELNQAVRRENSAEKEAQR